MDSTKKRKFLEFYPLMVYNGLKHLTTLKWGECLRMSLDKGTKEEITKKFQLHEKDTGSADVHDRHFDRENYGVN